ncbi:MAG TPA: glycosyltransferase [Syntrophorhabdaceae bacterium]|nr:glycosyltransferase [Syntrophorhabdaceae bacterium]HQM80380.1 glycosyltransferase [Syntrophorhabdaceae bacterium]
MVSVILPTFNAGEGINSFLTMIGNQTVECELVVIDSSSTDGTQEAVRSYGAKVISIEKTDFNHGGARNAAIRSSQGDIVVLFTQDALPCDERCIERLIEPLALEDVAASYGRQIPKAGAKPTERFARLFNYPDSPEVKGLEDVPRMGIKAFFFSNVFSAIRRKEFERLGMFPDDIIMFEDMIYAARLITNGYRIAYVPGAMVAHSHDYSLAEQFKRYRCAGASFRKHPWFMQYARSGKEGRSYFMRQMRYLVREKEYSWMAYALCEAVCKYCGYHLGLHYDTVSAAPPPQGGK